jgi:hypothetical protein
MSPFPIPRLPVRRLLRALPCVLLPLLPAVMAVGLVYALFGTHPGRFVPHLTDEFNYWHQIATFAAHGWNGGYYTVEEHPAAAAFSHFGVHGPGYVVLYGLIAKVVGWHLWSAPVFNMAVLALALAAFSALARPGPGRVGLAALVVALFWPLHTFLMTNMQASVHFAAAIVLAAVFARLLAARDAPPRAVAALGLVLIAAAALLRPTWAILLLPLFLLALPPGVVRRPGPAVFAVLGAAVLTGVLFAVYNHLAAPFPVNILAQLKERLAHGNPLGAARTLAAYAGNNLGAFLVVPDSPRHALAMAQRIAVLALAAYSGVRLVRAARARRAAGGRAWGLSDADAADGFHVVNLLGITVLCVLLRPLDTFHDYRPMAPHLLLSVLVHALSGRKVATLAFAGVYAVLSIAFVSEYRVYHYPRFYGGESPLFSPSERALYQARVADRIRFDPAAGPWTNTLVVDRGAYDKRLLAIPPGIGITRVFDWDRVDAPLKSRWLLIHRGSYPGAVARAPRMRPVAVTRFGTLFVNPDTAGGAPSGTASPP